jgi:hypothetical protein
MHDDTMFASVEIFAMGTTSFVGTFSPGVVPLAVFASSAAVVNALASAGRSIDPAPIAFGDVMKGRARTPQRWW